MSAYAKLRKPRAFLELGPAHDHDRVPRWDGLADDQSSMGGAELAALIDTLIDRIAERVATTIAERGDENQGGPADEWLDSLQAAEYLGLHRDTLRRMAAARTIPSEQDGRGCKLFFRRSALDTWRRGGGRARHLQVVAEAV